MKVKELLTTGGYGVKPYPPYNEEHVEVWRTKVKEGEQVAFLLTEEQAIEQFGEHDCWLAFHSDGTWNEPVTGEHVFAICIDKDGWKGDNGMVIKINGKEYEPQEPRQAVAVEKWYDRSRREWVIYPVDEDGNQLREAVYGFSRKEAEIIKKDLEVELGI